MKRVLLIRHGQASSATQGDYDNLSSLGEKQSRLMGAWWAHGEDMPGRVFVGPRRRHRQTHKAVLEGLGNTNNSWCAPTFIEALDEHHAQEVLPFGLKAVMHEESKEGALAKAIIASKGKSLPPLQELSLLFRRVMDLWVTEALDVPSVESWSAFRERVVDCLNFMCKEANGELAVAFTSGGVLGAATAHLLKGDAMTTLDLSWAVYNTGMVELKEVNGRWTMARFNLTPHLNNPEHMTFI